jgi:hypothetical protein
VAVADAVAVVATAVGAGKKAEWIGGGAEKRRLDLRASMTVTKTGTDPKLAVLLGAAGEQWAIRWIENLRKEGRAVSGGWPGTISEARSQASASAAQYLGRKSALMPGDLDTLARRVYEGAKKAWMARAVSEPDDETEDDAPAPSPVSKAPPRPDP